MKLIGLAGRAGCGKDTIADYLVDTYGFIKFSFSDALYNEVQMAFNLPDQSLLRARDTKEIHSELLQLRWCRDTDFINVAIQQIDAETIAAGNHRLLYPHGVSLSPRWVLQMWGTEFRRTQDPEYWVKRADAFVEAFLQNPYVGNFGGLVNTSVRYPNELEMICRRNGSVWHVHRRDLPPMANSGHTSEIPLPFKFGVDKEIHNNSTIERLGTGISLMLGSDANRIFVEDE